MLIRPLLGAIAALAVAAPAASASEIFATNNTAVITDPADPRLKDPLKGFERQVERIIERGGGDPRGSELLDGVFFDAERGTTTFERSRRFDVARVDDDELHTIADTIRERFGQSSVLTFDAGGADADAVELEASGVSAQALRDGLLADAEAREKLFGGSVTQDGRLLLVASLEDEPLARAFARKLGGKVVRARLGRREFVSGPLPVRVVDRMLVIDGAPSLALHDRRLDVSLGGESRSVPLNRFDRVRVTGGGGRLVMTGERFDARAAGDRVRLVADSLPLELDGIEILELHGESMRIGDLSATDAYQVDASGDVTVDGSGGDDQISAGSFGVLGPTYVTGGSRVTIRGLGGDDIISASVPSVAALDGGDGDDVLIGGPGDELLLGGRGFDDVSGGKGADAAFLGGDNDRFTWRPGDGNDHVDGGPGRESLFVNGSNDAEAFALTRAGRGLRLTRDVEDVTLDLERLDEIDALAGGGADTFAIGDLRGTGAALVDVNLGPIPLTAGGDRAADTVRVAGTGALTLVGKGTTATLSGLAATVNVSHSDGALDTLALDGGGALDTSAFDPAVIGLRYISP